MALAAGSALFRSRQKVGQAQSLTLMLCQSKQNLPAQLADKKRWAVASSKHSSLEVLSSLASVVQASLLER